MGNQIFKVGGDALRMWDENLPRALSKEENAKLLWEYQNTQDKNLKAKIRDKIVYGNMRLVAKIIKERMFYADSATKEDVLQEMIFAMIKAVDEFDFSKNAAFSTFLTTKISEGLERRNKYLNAKCRSGKEIVSLHQPTSKDGDAKFRYEDVLKDESVDFNSMLNKLEIEFVVTKILPKFSELEQQIFKKHFLQDVKQCEIAEEMCISHQYITKILKRMSVEIKEIYEKGDGANIAPRYKNYGKCVVSRATTKAEPKVEQKNK